jgi:hypothetical protein
MKDLLDTLNNALCILIALALVFLFIGEPDLWDRLHDKAMNGACAVPVATQPKD